MPSTHSAIGRPPHQRDGVRDRHRLQPARRQHPEPRLPGSGGAAPLDHHGDAVPVEQAQAAGGPRTRTSTVGRAGRTKAARSLGRRSGTAVSVRSPTSSNPSRTRPPTAPCARGRTRTYPGPGSPRSRRPRASPRAAASAPSRSIRWIAWRGPSRRTCRGPPRSPAGCDPRRSAVGPRPAPGRRAGRSNRGGPRSCGARRPARGRRRHARQLHVARTELELDLVGGRGVGQRAGEVHGRGGQLEKLAARPRHQGVDRSGGPHHRAAGRRTDGDLDRDPGRRRLLAGGQQPQSSTN